jgi:hypothetical protein
MELKRRDFDFPATRDLRPATCYSLPLRIFGAIHRDLAGAAVHADDSGRVGLVQRHDRAVRIFGLPGITAGDVFWDVIDVVSLFQIVERLRSFLFVLRVLIDHQIQRLQILAEVVFLFFPDAMAVDRRSGRQQDEDDADDHHHLNQGKSVTILGRWFLCALHLRT